MRVHLMKKGLKIQLANLPVSLLRSLIFNSSCCISVPKNQLPELQWRVLVYSFTLQFLYLPVRSQWYEKKKVSFLCFSFHGLAKIIPLYYTKAIPPICPSFYLAHPCFSKHTVAEILQLCICLGITNTLHFFFNLFRF